MSLAQISDRLANAIAQLDETYEYLLHLLDAAVVSRVAADLAALKLEAEQGSFQAAQRVRT